MTVSPTALAPFDSYPGIGGCGSTTPNDNCKFRLTETSGSNYPIQWSALLVADAGYTATFSPASGTLYPGNSVTVKVAGGFCNDQDLSSILIVGSYGPPSDTRSTANAVAVMWCD